MTFAAHQLFTRVVAAFSCLVGRFNRLAVHDSRRRRHFSFLGLAHPVAQRVVDESPGPVLGPVPIVAVDGLPRTEIRGQEPPSTTRADDVEHGIDQGTTLQRWSATFSLAGLGSWYQRLDVVPFFINQISWIMHRMRLHPIHL